VNLSLESTTSSFIIDSKYPTPLWWAKLMANLVDFDFRYIGNTVTEH
jgi:hypothetical protein